MNTFYDYRRFETLFIILRSITESHESEDLSTESPNYYSQEELAEMTPEELIAIGYPNPYEYQ